MIRSIENLTEWQKTLRDEWEYGNSWQQHSHFFRILLTHEILSSAKPVSAEFSFDDLKMLTELLTESG